MARIYIGVGANLDPEVHIRTALRRLRATLRITGISTFYRTTPIGRPEQPPFINGVIAADTDLPPYQVKFDVLQPIEIALGRVRTADKYAARPIDLDLLLYDDLVIADDSLMLPDPEIALRPFLAVPLAELSAELVLPDGRGLRAIAATFTDYGMIPLEVFTSALRELLHATMTEDDTPVTE